MLTQSFAEWGFSRLGEKANNRYSSYTFASPLFRRDQPHLCNSMRLIKKSKPSKDKKLLFHLFDAREVSTTIPTGYLNESTPPSFNQVKMSWWEDSLPLSDPYHWGPYVPFLLQNYLSHLACHYLPRQNRHDWIISSAKHHQEIELETKSENNREALAAVALMNLANFAELNLSHLAPPHERSNTSANT